MTSLLWGGVEGRALAEVCHALLTVAVSVIAQSTLLLLLGLAVARSLRRSHGPEVQSLVLRATLTAVAGGALLALLFAGRVAPVWQLALPPVTASVEPGRGLPHPLFEILAREQHRW